jgi:hypothetical protein
MTKADGGDQKPFGSVFWHNGARAIWFAQVADESPDGQILHLGLFNRKSNLGRILAPVGFKITFEENRTIFESDNPADNPDLAQKMTIRQRMIHVLKKGSMDIKTLADEIDAEPDSVRRTAVRHKAVFRIFEGGNISLLQRDTESGQFVRRTEV